MAAYVIVDGIRMDQDTLEDMLSALDPLRNPDQWDELYKFWKMLDKKSYSLFRKRRKARK